MQFLWFALVVTILSLTLMFMFVRSKYGRAIRAIRDDEIAASASGVNTSYYKVLTFAYSAFFAGVAGARFGYKCAWVLWLILIERGIFMDIGTRLGVKMKKGFSLLE